MTREEIKGILPDITDEQLKSVLDINSTDIGKAKKDYEAVSGQLATAKTTIKQLNDAKSDYDDIKRQLGEYQVAEQKRKNDELQAQKDAAIRSRFDKLHGERKYLNDFTQQGIFNEFKAALEKDESVGKSDADIFEGIVKGIIIPERRGGEGFGYDPIFQPESYDKTFAELGNDIKNTISHRAKAVNKLADYLKNL